MATDITQPTQPQVVKRNDAYTGLLAISFLAMVGGCVLLYLEYQQYETLTPQATPKPDVPGTLKPTPNPPKEQPKAKEVEPENPMPMPDKDKAGRLPGVPSDDAVVIPIPGLEPARLPDMVPSTPVQVGAGASNKVPDLVIPASGTEASKPLQLEPLEIPPVPMISSGQVPATKVNPSEPATEQTPIIPGVGTEQPAAKLPPTNVPMMKEPSLEDAPPLKTKPFVPPPM